MNSLILAGTVLGDGYRYMNLRIIQSFNAITYYISVNFNTCYYRIINNTMSYYQGQTCEDKRGSQYIECVVMYMQSV